MADQVVWVGTVVPLGASFINVTRDPLSGDITQIDTQGPLSFTPSAEGLPVLNGQFLSSWKPAADGQTTTDPVAALTAALPALFYLDPAKVFTVTITAADPNDEQESAT